VPLLETDGDSKASISQAAGWVQAKYLGAVLEVHFPEGAKASLGEVVANRQGNYRTLVVEFEGAEGRVHLAMTGT
jgi:hypothetical protein